MSPLFFCPPIFLSKFSPDFSARHLSATMPPHNPNLNLNLAVDLYRRRSPALFVPFCKVFSRISSLSRLRILPNCLSALAFTFLLSLPQYLQAQSGALDTTFN